MSKYNLLIVEDEFVIASLIQNQLEKLGHNVVGIADSGKIAIEMVKSKHPDLILMDIVIKGDLDGIDTVAKIHSFFDVPVLYLTAHTSKELINRLKETNPYGYLIKPVKIEDLKANIEIAICKHDHKKKLIELNNNLKKEIEEHKKTEKKLKNSESRFRNFLDNLNDMAYETDNDFKITYANKYFNKFVHKNNTEIIGQSFIDFFTDESREKAIEAFNKTLQGENKEYELVLKNGKIINLKNSTLKDDKITGVFGIARDITQKKDLEKMIQQSMKMEALVTLSGGIAHEFNNMLFIIQGNTALIKSKAPLTDKTRSYIRNILDTINRAADLVRQILTFTSRYCEEAETEIIDIDSIINDVIRLTIATCPSNLKIKNNTRYLNSKILCNKAQLEQALVNIIANAEYELRNSDGYIEFNSDLVILNKSEINNEKIKPGTYVKIDITDNGGGIKPEIKDRIFDPFFTSKPFGDGSGMGLSVTYGVIEKNDGFIEVDSEVNVGSTFTIYLPVYTERELTSG